MPATPTPKAFFSYSREDADFVMRLAADLVMRLAADLRAAGAAVWLDQLDIRPGDRWDRSIESALGDCARLLVILSPSSVSSTNVMDEVSFALEEQKSVIPVLYRDCKIPFRLRRVEYIDCRADYQRGLKQLLSILPCQEIPAVHTQPVGQDPDAERQDVTRRKTELEPQKRAADADEVRTKSATRKYLLIAAAGVVVLAIVVWAMVGRSNQNPNPPASRAISTEPTATAKSAPKPSFECRGIPRTRPIETLICQDVSLAGLESAMTAAYNEKLSSLSEADKLTLEDDQRKWLNKYTKTCRALAPGDDITAPDFHNCVQKHLTNRAHILQSWTPK